MNDRVAVHFHLYYLPALDGFLRLFANLDGVVEYDLFVTTPHDDSEAEAKIRSFVPSAVIWKVPNRGYDIGPFIDFLNRIDLNRYGSILKLHTKGDKFFRITLMNDYWMSDYHWCGFLTRALLGPPRMFEVKWARVLLSALLDSGKGIRRNVKLLQSGEVGMVGSEYCLLSDPVFYEKHLPQINAILRRIGLAPVSECRFVAGTMFMARADVFAPLQHQFGIGDFDESDAACSDFTLAHAMERVFGILAMRGGRKIAGVDPDRFRIIRSRLVSGFLRFCYQDRVTTSGHRLVKVCKIPVWRKRVAADGNAAGVSRLRCFAGSAAMLLKPWDRGKLRERQQLLRDCRLMAESGWFDAGYYRFLYPDVVRNRQNPLLHYAVTGWRENRDPSPYFSTAAYLKQNPDVERLGVNPLVHYLRWGNREKRPYPREGQLPERSEQRLFDYWLALQSCRLRYRLNRGDRIRLRRDRQLQSACFLMAKSGLFDRHYYRRLYPDIALTGIDPLLHYAVLGWKEHRNPSPYFSTDIYLRNHPDVVELGINPLVHYLRWGKRERRRLWLPEPEFPSSAVAVRIDNLARTASGGRIAVFAAFHPGGKIPATTLHYLRELRKVAATVVAVGDHPLLPGEEKKLEEFVDCAIFERHGEYDFGSYKRGYELVRSAGYLDRAEELVFCNDSCYGPVFPLDGVMQEMASRECDFWGMSGNPFPAYHLQSYFLAFRKAVFLSEPFRDFMAGIVRQNDAMNVIVNYEIGLSRLLLSCGFKAAALVENADDWRGNKTLEPLKLMREFGMPLVKVKCFREEYGESFRVSPEAVLEFIESHNRELHRLIAEEWKDRGSK